MTFYMPVKLYTGSGSFAEQKKEVAALGGKCLIVTGKTSAKKSGALDDATAVLDEMGIAYEIYDGIAQNPTVVSCMEAGKIAAAFGAKDVTGVDISEFACDCARENAALNGFDNVRFVAANAFDFLKEQCAAGEQYDVVILDPPAFTKTRRNLEAAERGYKEINLRGIKLCRPGGYLVTCSCSQHMLPGAFRDVVLSAAQDARAHLFQVEYRTQGRDHPILPAAIETQYLKCGIFRVDK